MAVSIPIFCVLVNDHSGPFLVRPGAVRQRLHGRKAELLGSDCLLRLDAELVMGNNLAVELIVRDCLITHEVIVFINNRGHLIRVPLFSRVAKIERLHHFKLPVLELVPKGDTLRDIIGFHVVAEVVIGVLRDRRHDGRDEFSGRGGR